MVRSAALRVLVAIVRLWLFATLGFGLARSLSTELADLRYPEFLGGLLRGEIDATSLCAACDPRELIAAGFALPAAALLGAVLVYGALVLALRLLFELFRSRPGATSSPARSRFAIAAAFAVLALLAALWLAQPHLDAWFGADPSRELLRRASESAFPLLALALSATAVGWPLALAWGLAAGCAGGRVSAAIAALLDLFRGLPWLFLLILFAVLAEPSIELLAFVIGASAWFGTALGLLEETAAKREAPYMLAARIAGVSRGARLRRHLLPNLGEAMLAAAAGIFLRASALAGLLAALGLALKTVGKPL